MATTTYEKSTVATVNDRRKRNDTIRRVAEAVGPRIILCVMSIIYLIPLYWMVITALKPNPELSAFPPTFWPQSVHWENFATAVSEIPFWTYFFNSTTIAVLNVIGAVVANLLVAYGFS